MAGAWIDISMRLCAGMAVWPSDMAVRVERAAAIGASSDCNITDLHLCAHTGTHVDAPLHYIAGGAAIDAMEIDALLGPARVVHVEDAAAIGVEHLPGDIARGERLLFRTSNSPRLTRHATRFDEGYVYLSARAARVLVERGVRAVGIDALSIAGFHDELTETHRILLAAGVWVIEGLDLTDVEAGAYDLACLPLRIVGADGAPARAALRRL